MYNSFLVYLALSPIPFGGSFIIRPQKSYLTFFSAKLYQYLPYFIYHNTLDNIKKTGLQATIHPVCVEITSLSLENAWIAPVHSHKVNLQSVGFFHPSLMIK